MQAIATDSVSCKTAEPIEMPFGVVSGQSGVGRGMVLDGGGDRRRERGRFGVNLGRLIVTNVAFATPSSQITLRTYCKTISN